MTAAQPTRRTLTSRAADSAWIAGEPHLADTVAELEAEVGADQARLPERAVAEAQPGPIDPVRLARHATAASVSRAIRITTGLPALVVNRKPLSDPQAWLQESAVEAFVDQLALGGAASAELARLIEGGGSLFPDSLRAELAKRDIRPVPVAPGVVQQTIDRAFGRPVPGGRVRLLDGEPITAIPVSQLHRARTDEDPVIAVRVRRPRIARDLLHDSRLSASAAMAVGRVAPDAGGMGPLGFVQLVLRQNLESTDLRFEALNLVELGMLVEDAQLEGFTVARPLPGYVDERALGIEHVEGTPLLDAAAEGLTPDAAAGLRALVAVTLESAIEHGVFWADPAPEHLVVRPDGSLVLVGAGTVGRFSPELRLAGVRVLKSVLTGEHEGMIDGMRIAGAVSSSVDTDALLAALQSSEALDPSKILFGGEHALLDALNAAVGIMLAHKLQPPVEVVLMLRTVFAVGELVRLLDPESTAGLTAALMPLLPRLPEIIANAEAAVGDA